MKKIVASAVLILMIGVIPVAKVCAQTYADDFPAYVTITGSAWLEVQTPQGRTCIVVPVGYIRDTFGFSGQIGYNVANTTTATVSGDIYHATQFTYYGNPSVIQCRFTRMNTLEVNEPYWTGVTTAYRWISLPVTAIHGTNIALMDDAGDRQNDFYRYSQDQQISIIILVMETMIFLILILFVVIDFRRLRVK